MMRPLRILISSVQQEFKEDRLELCRWLKNDPLMRALLNKSSVFKISR